jgi:choline-sulfatase
VSRLRRSLLAALLIAPLGAQGCSGHEGRPSSFAGAPLVIVSIDTLRADHLPAYGYDKVATPNIDALRRDGVLYSNAYSQAPLTLPSHLSLLTGLVPPEHGVRDNLGYRFDRRGHPTLGDLLRAHGYASGAAVSAYVLRASTGLGASFDFYDDEVPAPQSGEAAALVRRPGEETVRRAIDWVRTVGQRPFFLFVHLYEPHYPYEPTEPFRSRYPLAYDGTIAMADAAVGTLLEALRGQGLYDRSLIVLVSDHGEGLGDHGEQEHGILLYRETLHVPLLVKLPGSRDGGKRVDRAVALIDVVPTAAAALGFQAPSGLRGHSLLDPGDRRGDRIYSETLYPRIHLGWSELRSLADEEYHVIDGPKPEIYRLRDDPRESRDLSGEKSAAVASAERELRGYGTGLDAPGRIDPEESEKLRALGYLAGGPEPSGGDRPNPRDHVAEHEEMKTAFHLAREGRSDEAIAAFRNLLARQPGLFDVQWELATTLARRGRYEESADAFHAAMGLSSPLAHLVAISLGQVEVRLGRLDAAQRHARQGMDADAPRAHEILARVALARSRLDDADREAALIQGSAADAALRDLVQAEILIRRGAFERALAATEAIRSRAAGRPVRGLEFLRGDALARLNRNDEAQEAFRKEIQDFPHDPQAYASLAIVLAVGGHPKGDVDRVMDAMFLASPGPPSALLAARTLEFLGEPEAARQWRRRGGEGP